MHTRKGRGLPNLAALREAPMGSSRPPRWRAWLVRMVERFGFVLVCVLTLITLAVFFIGPDLIRQNAEGILGRTGEQEHGLFADGQSGSAGQPGLAGADVSQIDVLDRLQKEGLDVPLIVGGIIPDDDAKTLEDAGVARVYTPKDFDLTRIVGELVELVAEKHAA